MYSQLHFPAPFTPENILTIETRNFEINWVSFRVKENQLDAQIILSIFCQALHVPAVSRIISTKRCVLTLVLYLLNTPETCRSWRNILRISCASSWFIFTRLYRNTRLTKYKIWFWIKPNWCTVFLSMHISFLCIFRATMCPSSGETTIFMRHLLLVILHGRLSGRHSAPLMMGTQ